MNPVKINIVIMMIISVKVAKVVNLKVLKIISIVIIIHSQRIDLTFYLLGCYPTTSRGAPCAPKSMCREPPRGGGRSCARALCIAISDDRGAESSVAPRAERVEVQSRGRLSSDLRGRGIAQPIALRAVTGSRCGGSRGARRRNADVPMASDHCLRTRDCLTGVTMRRECLGSLRTADLELALRWGI
jgi:hypothetical protein